MTQPITLLIAGYLSVSKNRDFPPKSWISKKGVSIILTIHFWGTTQITLADGETTDGPPNPLRRSTSRTKPRIAFVPGVHVVSHGFLNRQGPCVPCGETQQKTKKNHGNQKRENMGTRGRKHPKKPGEIQEIEWMDFRIQRLGEVQGEIIFKVAKTMIFCWFIWGIFALPSCTVQIIISQPLQGLFWINPVSCWVMFYSLGPWWKALTLGDSSAISHQTQ